MTFNKKLLAGLVTLAAASAANATVVVGGDNGFEFSVDGEINQFYVYSKDKAGTGPSTSYSEVRDGLLPAFLGFNIKAPTTNGLDVAARVSISPGTSATSRGSSMEQREAFFTVDGSFGQVLAGKALGLYGSHNILTDQTLYGVGWGVSNTLNSSATTTLGRINMGYDYADWRSQIKWTSPSMSGFKLALAAVDPSAATSLIIASGQNNKSLRYEADLTYAADFDGGNVMAWISTMTQSNRGAAHKNDGKTIGATLNASGFEFMAQYSKSKQGTSADGFTQVLGQLTTGGTTKGKYDQYIVQGGYNFGGSTRLVAGYSNYNVKTKGLTYTQRNQNDREMYTVGLYHDVTANLKLVAEFSNVQSSHKGAAVAGGTEIDKDIFSVGGFVSW